MVTIKVLKRISIIVLFSLILLYISSLNTYAVTFKYIWQNTTVEIPLGASIEDYKQIPKASLYKDGSVLVDANITYNTEGDWLYYFKDINPYKVGTYCVWYKAYDSKYKPGTCTGYKALINFVVKDKTKPTIDIFEPIYRVRRGEEYNLENNFYAHDNYGLSEVKVIDNTNINVVGEYKALIVAIDLDNNQISKSFIVEVYEDSYPDILYDIPGGILEVPLNGNFDIKGVFSAFDRVDGDITDKIEFDDFFDDKTISYSFSVSVVNSANLKTTKTITISVIDSENPTITLSTNRVLLDYKTDFYNYDFTKYIKEITDNDLINYDNLEITSDIKNEIGNYNVYYKYSDGINITTEVLEVVLVVFKLALLTTLTLKL